MIRYVHTYRLTCPHLRAFLSSRWTDVSSRLMPGIIKIVRRMRLAVKLGRWNTVDRAMLHATRVNSPEFLPSLQHCAQTILKGPINTDIPGRNTRQMYRDGYTFMLRIWSNSRETKFYFVRFLAASIDHPRPNLRACIFDEARQRWRIRRSLIIIGICIYLYAASTNTV